ncbi:MAG: TRAP transporter large permease [Clostridiaceae bacterium]|nr:TRAP transporter large permease [Clostridiaceae bacterium]
MVSNVLMLAAYTFIILIVLMALKVPISFALCISTLAGVILTVRLPVMVVAQRMFYGLDSFTLIAIPLFMLAGHIMAIGGVTKDLIDLSNVFVGWMSGGLAYINVVSSMIFAGITGTASSDSSSIGGILIPTMINKGYDKDFTVAVTATSSTIGIMIPPSIPLVLYGIAAGVSIGDLFMAGIVPGVLTGVVLIGISAVISKKRKYPAEEKYSLKKSLRICLKSIPALMTVVIIIGGITTGFFTPTEAAGIACAYTALLAVYYYKELRWRDFPELIYKASLTMGIVALMISAATALGWFFTSQGIPMQIAKALMSVTNNKYVILLLINLLLLFVGMWMDLAPAVTLFTPILLPIVTAIGISPLHFGIIMVVNLAIGLFTPPVGVCLFIGCSIAEISIADVIKAFIPFFIGMLFVLVIIVLVPQVCTILPALLK